MLKLSTRTLHSPKLKSFIEDSRNQEYGIFKDALIDLRDCGRIDYCGPTSVLGDCGGSNLRLSVMLQKFEFSEPEEVIKEVRKDFGEMWQPFFDSLLREVSSTTQEIIANPNDNMFSSFQVKNKISGSMDIADR